MRWGRALGWEPREADHLWKIWYGTTWAAGKAQDCESTTVGSARDDGVARAAGNSSVGALENRQRKGGKQRDRAESRAFGSYGFYLCDCSSEHKPSICTHIKVRAGMEGTESNFFADVSNPILPLPEQPVSSKENPEHISNP
jgi:hypothetical protein